MEQILFSGISPNDLFERLEQIIDRKLKGLFPLIEQKPKAEYYTREEVAKLLKITLPTLHDWTKSGRLQSYKIGKRVLYRLTEIEASLHRVGQIKFKKGGNHGA